MAAITSADREELQSLAESANRELRWPAASWSALALRGVLAWSVPPEWGGLGYSSLEQLEGNESLASACLTSAFLLSLREAAIRLIIKGPQPIRKRYFAAAARGREVVWCHPVYANRCLYLHNDKEIICVSMDKGDKS